MSIDYHEYLISLFGIFLFLVLPFMIGLGAFIAIIIIAQKGKEKALLLYFSLSVISVLCMCFFLFMLSLYAEPNDFTGEKNYFYYLFRIVWTFIWFVLPVLISVGAIIALFVTIKKKGKKVILPYILLPWVSVVCILFSVMMICGGGPYSREPVTENVKLVAEEGNRAEYPISDEDLNAVFETCIDYFKNGGDYDFCELIGLRYLYMYSPGGNDVAMIEVRYNGGFFSDVQHYGKFYKLERDRNSNEWVFDSVNTAP